MPYPVFSCDHNPDKENPDYYSTFLEKHDLTIDDVVYFEHNHQNADSARSIGIPTFLYNKVEKNIDEACAILGSGDLGLNLPLSPRA